VHRWLTELSSSQPLASTPSPQIMQNRDGNSFTRSRPNTFIPNIAPWIDSQGAYFQNKEGRTCFQPIHAKALCICSRCSPSSRGHSATPGATSCVCDEVPLGPLEIIIFFLPSRNPDVLSHRTRYNGGRLSLLHVTVSDPTLVRAMFVCLVSRNSPCQRHV
jgi:hypothetical protein